MKKILTNAQIICDAYSNPVEKNIVIDNDLIVDLTDKVMPDCEIIDLANKIVIPGFVQTHVHFCQTLFKGLADDMSLLDWLRRRIWPLEASHDEESTYISALLSGIELLSGGTTSVCVMESVRYADATAQALKDLGIRATFGKAMMDCSDTPVQLGGLPKNFRESTNESIASSLRLYRDWHGKNKGRISYAFMPRGVLTTSEELFQRINVLSKELGILIHTHACETQSESELVRKLRGLTEIKYLNKLGIMHDRLLLAHCVYVDDDDIRILREKNVKVASCPLANLKLASGIAPLQKLVETGVVVSLGSDGAPCNNTLDMFSEMRFASLLQKGITGDPLSLNASTTFEIATLGGAKALGYADKLGVIDRGQKADMAILDWRSVHVIPQPPSVSALVYSGSTDLVTDVMVGGEFVIRNSRHVTIDHNVLSKKAESTIERLMRRV